MDWLVGSIVVSLVATVVINIALRQFPGAGDRAARRLDQMARSVDRRADDGRRVRVWFPWKATLIVSVALTVLLDLVLRVA